MIAPRFSALAAPLLFLACLATGIAFAQAPGEVPADTSGARSGSGRHLEMPGNITVRAGDWEGDEASNIIHFTHYVDIETGDARIQADDVVYNRALGTVEATGNVVLTFTGAVLAGRRLLYRVGPQTGEVDDVVGYLDQDNAILRAAKVERLGPEWIGVEKATFSTCSQPTPYWAFRIGHGKFHLGQYAYLHNVEFRARALPLFWSPYIVWPIKTGRATGLLFPEFRNSNKLGFSVGVPYYWSFADNADVTLTATGYTKVGLGLGADLHWLPTWLGWSNGKVSWINDQVRGKNRYYLQWNQSQPFENGFQLTANVQAVSDFDYFTDYETNLMLASSPQTNSVVDLSRSWSWYSLSFRARRYEQFFVSQFTDFSLLSSKVITNALPQVEFRGRSQRLWNSPVYLSFESSAVGLSREILVGPNGGSVQDESQLVTVDRAQWGRFDLFPQFQVPVTKEPWGDLTLNTGWRGTFYSARMLQSQVVSRSLFRNLFNAGFTFSGPRFQRIFSTPNWSYSKKLKHVIEPFVTYQWRPRSSIDTTEIPTYDEIDNAPGEVSQVAYGIRQRFLVLRSPETGRATGLATAREATFKELERQTKEQQEVQAKTEGPVASEDKLEVEQNAGPVEFASIEIGQSRSFNNHQPLLFEYSRNESGALVLTPRFYSPVTLRARLNPTAEQVVDATLGFDPANGRLTDTSLSALYRFSPRLYTQGSWYRRLPAVNGLGEATNFLRTRWGYISSNRRFSLETDWDLNLVNHKLEHQHYEARWATQCCSFRAGYDQRSFVDNYRREFSIVVDLFGIGEILKFQGGH